MKAKAIRKVRGYKIADKPYLKAMSRAKKAKVSLATEIEKYVTSYSQGFDTITFKNTMLSVPELTKPKLSNESSNRI